MKNWKLEFICKWSNRFDLLIFAYIGSLVEKHYPGFINGHWIAIGLIACAILGINLQIQLKRVRNNNE